MPGYGQNPYGLSPYGDPSAVASTTSLIQWAGLWSSTTTYAIGDAVSYLGSSYVATVASTNVLPSINPVTWNLLAAAGQVGPSGTAGLNGQPGSHPCSNLGMGFAGVTVVSAAYATVLADRKKLVAATASVTVTLTTTGLAAGNTYHVFAAVAGVTVKGQTGTINGGASVTLNSTWGMFIFDGTNFYALLSN